MIVVLACAVRADDLRREVDALRPNDVTAQGAAVLDDLEQRARDALAAIHRCTTARDADRMRGRLRRELTRSLGTDRLPWPPDLRPRVVGILPRDAYRIEKVVYQSLPGAPVPAHLYVPASLDRPAPSVLFYPGHWWPDSKARPDFQAFCINMARLGFVVLNFDPFGQGERGVSSRDHRRTEALLVGVAQQGFAEYETRCALEYLLSRKEVDQGRVGITGASGGGFNTWVTAALDDRIAVAVPVVGTSEFAEQIHVCRPLDWYHASEHCHFVPGLIRYANNHELLAMSAPKPVLIIAASEDQSFPLAGVRQVAGYGRTLYESYGAGDKTGLVVDRSEGHGYQRVKREAAYGWFLRWLAQRGDGRPYPEPPTETLPFDAEELRCFPPGRNEGAGPAMIEAVRRLARDLPPSPPRIDLGAVLGRVPSVLPARVKVTGARLERLLIPSEAGLDVPAFLLRPAGEVRGLVVALDDRGKEVLASDPVVREAHARGWAVCGVDPRGIGELAVDKPGWVFAVSLLLGENFIGRQAWDVGRVLEALGAPGALPGKPIGLYARGQDACVAGRRSDRQPPGRRRGSPHGGGRPGPPADARAGHLRRGARGNRQRVPPGVPSVSALEDKVFLGQVEPETSKGCIRRAGKQNGSPGTLSALRIEPDLGGIQNGGRLAEVPGEAGDAGNVGLDRLGLESMQGHVVDHSLSLGSHGESS
ncbi:MAG: alpha/beta hydrolase family protein [Isosphaerales bacterium]